MVTLAEWALQVLSDGGWPTPGAQAGLVAQAVEEGSHAAWNPEDTTEPEAGARAYNAAGVRDYTSETQGIEATLATLDNGDYPQVLAALKRGSAPAYVQAVANSPWGTWQGDPQGALRTLATVQGAWPDYSSRLVAGSVGPAAPVQSPLTDDSASPAPADPLTPGGSDMAFLAQQPGQAGVWVVAGDLSCKEPVLTGEDEAVLLQAGYAKLNLSAAQLARIPTVPEA